MASASLAKAALSLVAPSPLAPNISGVSASFGIKTGPGGPFDAGPGFSGLFGLRSGAAWQPAAAPMIQAPPPAIATRRVQLFGREIVFIIFGEIFIQADAPVAHDV